MLSALKKSAFWLLFIAALYVGDANAQNNVSERIEIALAGSHRSEANRSRDKYRHPMETLLFFGLRSDMHVVEIWPGSGWYTEVLAPVLRDRGRLYAAHYLVTPATSTYYRDARVAFVEKLRQGSQLYDRAIVTSLDAPRYVAVAPRESTDLVVTFRNVHNWTAAGNDAATFRAMFSALKLGGILGVVEHRARPGTSLAVMKHTGYMTEAHVVGLAERAGFILVSKSEINANPNDTKDHPHGVWSLPPSLRGGAENRDKYLAIGESDRMTLKFVKSPRAIKYAAE